ncbi:MAG: SCP2 sterol-binding domain-containing protein [Pseudomonadales bacterium]
MTRPPGADAGRTAPGGPEAVLADVLADLANRSLDLDPASRARLAALEGNRIQLSMDLGPLGQRDLTLTVISGQLRAFARAAQSPHVILRGNPAALAAWLLGADTDSAGGLSIDGDTTVLAEFSALLRGFRPDVAGPLERVIGAEGARTLLGTAELALAGLRSALEGAGRSVREGAAQTFVDRAQASRFLDDLDDLRLRVDRLAARVDTEAQRRSGPPGSGPRRSPA